MENDILIAVHQLLVENKKPTVATVKGKLATPVPMPSIIKVLQKTMSLSANDVAKLLPQAPSVDTSIVEKPADIAELSQQVAELTAELKATKQQLNDLQRLVEVHLGNEK